MTFTKEHLETFPNEVGGSQYDKGRISFGKQGFPKTFQMDIRGGWNLRRERNGAFRDSPCIRRENPEKSKTYIFLKMSEVFTPPKAKLLDITMPVLISRPLPIM